MKTNKQNKDDKEISIEYRDDNSISINILDKKLLKEIGGAFDSNLKA